MTFDMASAIASEVLKIEGDCKYVIYNTQKINSLKDQAEILNDESNTHNLTKLMKLTNVTKLANLTTK